MIDLDQAIRKLSAISGDEALVDLVIERRWITSCDLRGGTPRIRSELVEGIGLRRFDGSDVLHRHVAATSEDALEALFAADWSGRPPVAIQPLPAEGEPQPEAEQLLAVAERCAGRAGGEEGLRLEVSLSRNVREVTVVTQEGRVAEERQEQTGVAVSAIAKRDKRVRQARRFHGARTPADLTGADLDRLADDAVHAAEDRLEGVEAPSGEMPVILGPGSPAGLIHEICGHGLEGDIAAHPTSAYHDRIGERLSEPAFTLIDDPGAPDWAPVYGVDDEGTAATATVLVDEGLLRSYLHDRRSALQAGTEPNGHARRLSYAHAPLPRMSTTYVAAGSDPAEEIIADTERGLYVTSISGGDTDFDSGRFTIRVSEGRIVEKGKLGPPIRGAAISGIGPEVLANIDRVGDDLRFNPHGHTCNKLDQYPLMVSVGQPTLRVSSMLVWGG